MAGSDKSARGASADAGRGHGVLSATLMAWLETESLATATVLDVGTGSGRLALALAPRARRVFGIDTDAGALVEARRRARRADIGNVLFVVADAEQADYRALARPDVPRAVVAHLCMSDAIIARAGAGLGEGGLLAFAAFHVDQWLETGRVSRFAYDESRARRVLETAGFRVEAVEVERQAIHFGSTEEALVCTARFRPKWEADGRWSVWDRFVAHGGRTLTESRLIVRARRAGACGRPQAP